MTSVGVLRHVQFLGDCELEDSRSFTRGGNLIIVVGHFYGLELPGGSHIHRPGLQIDLFFVQEGQQGGAKV